MKLVLVTDAWYPQLNGVVRTLTRVKEDLEARGHAVRVIAPADFVTFPCPTYPEIRLAIGAGRRVTRLIDAAQPDCIHIATEGPLGLAARRYCARRGLPFTTAYHTRFPEYIHARCRLPLSVSYRFMRWFHGASSGMMVASPSLCEELTGRGFERVAPWTRGVDLDLFHPQAGESPPQCEPFVSDPRPIMLYVGRVAVEKNIEAFLKMRVGGTKLVVGDGPALREMRQKYPEARFAGRKEGAELAQFYAASDVFVFPSRTDTFGLVLLEALASGLPVAAYPVTGPKDVINGSGVGVLDENLGDATLRALRLDRRRCREYAARFSWSACADQFLSNLHPFGRITPAAGVALSAPPGSALRFERSSARVKPAGGQQRPAR